MGLIQKVITSKQMHGDLDTFCVKCKQKQVLREFGDDGSYLRRCGCGCEIYRYHAPDEFHDIAYFTRNYIPKSCYKKNYKKLNKVEKIAVDNGFDVKGGKIVKKNSVGR